MVAPVKTMPLHEEIIARYRWELIALLMIPRRLQKQRKRESTNSTKTDKTKVKAVMMSESEYYEAEISDNDLHALADAGEFYLEESGYYLRPTQAECQQLMKHGQSFLGYSITDHEVDRG